LEQALIAGREIAVERVSVASSNLVSVGYDERSEILEVEFKGGRVYQYMNVPQIVYDQLMSASSQGSYFNANIRNNYAAVPV
jgi:KTSC domain